MCVGGRSEPMFLNKSKPCGFPFSAELLFSQSVLNTPLRQNSVPDVHVSPRYAGWVSCSCAPVKKVKVTDLGLSKECLPEAHQKLKNNFPF